MKRTKFKTVKGTCINPYCLHKFEIPQSVKHYTCICGKEYEIKTKVK